MAITNEDVNAYKNGTLSNYYWKLLKKADEMWNAAESDDYTTKAIAHRMAQVARESYSTFVDDFDYTFGTGYSAIDDGTLGKFMKVSKVASSSGSYSATTFLYYERYQNNGRNYVQIKKSNGYGTSSVRGRTYVSGIEYTYGASKIFGGKQTTQTTTNSQYNIIFSNIPGVPDDKGVYAVTGINAKFEFTNSFNKKYYLTVGNNIYDSFNFDEKGNMYTGDKDGFDILIEALQRGER